MMVISRFQSDSDRNVCTASSKNVVIHHEIRPTHGVHIAFPAKEASLEGEKALKSIKGTPNVGTEQRLPVDLAPPETLAQKENAPQNHTIAE